MNLNYMFSIEIVKYRNSHYLRETLKIKIDMSYLLIVKNRKSKKQKVNFTLHANYFTSLPRV